jgi:Protein of unknown function (DUF3551)
MKPLLFGIGILAAVSSFSPRAQAQNYPWCAYLGGGMGGGGVNCGFVSFEQCMETARGNGSDCRVNTQYSPPPGPHDPAAASAYHHRHVVTKTSKNNS